MECKKCPIYDDEYMVCDERESFINSEDGQECCRYHDNAVHVPSKEVVENILYAYGIGDTEKCSEIANEILNQIVEYIRY